MGHGWARDGEGRGGLLPYLPPAPALRVENFLPTICIKKGESVTVTGRGCKFRDALIL